MDRNFDREDKRRNEIDRQGFGRAPVRGSTYDRGGYGYGSMSGRSYPGGRAVRGHRYAPDRYDQTGFEPAGYDTYGPGSRYERPDRYDERPESRGDYDRNWDDRDYDRHAGGEYVRGGYGSQVFGEGIDERRESSAPWTTPGPHTGRGPQGYDRSDERLVEEVSERLTSHGQIDASNIRVKVENGEVTLEGTVASRKMKRLAEDMAESVWDVKDVHNRLRIER